MGEPKNDVSAAGIDGTQVEYVAKKIVVGLGVPTGNDDVCTDDHKVSFSYGAKVGVYSIADPHTSANVGNAEPVEFV